MLAGHFAVAFAAKRAAPRASLGVLFVAAQLLDLLWAVFVLAGVERVAIAPAGHVVPLVFDHYPWSHSLLLAGAWALAAGAAYRLTHGDFRSAGVVAALVLSHWVLDLVTHLPDLPPAPGSSVRLGLGLWNHPMASGVLELVMLGIGYAIYLGATRSRGRGGTWGMAVLVAFIAAIQLGSMLGPPPPDIGAVVWADMAMWLLVAWAWIADRARLPR